MIRHITLALIFIAVCAWLNPQPANAQEFAPHTVAFGETLDALAQRSGASLASVALINGLTSRDALLAGQKINLPAPLAPGVQLHRVQPNETLTQIATRYGVSPYLLRRMNNLPCSTCLTPGQQLRVMAAQNSPDSARATPDALPAPLLSVQLSSVEPKQGDVLIIRVATQGDSRVEANLGTYEVNFAPDASSGPGNYNYIGLMGVDAMLGAGHYPVVITATSTSGANGVAAGQVEVKRGGYILESVALSPKLAPLLDPKLNDAEEAKVTAVYGQFTSQQWWSEPFVLPIKGKLLADYGNRRVYNGLNLGTYHSGYDISSVAGRPVLAAAPGRVVLAQELAIRGLAVIVDHGRGVFTGYFHLSKINVKPGQLINVGDAVGAVGTTGRSQGNHVHFDLAVGGVTVDPSRWLREALP